MRVTGPLPRATLDVVLYFEFCPEGGTNSIQLVVDIMSSEAALSLATWAVAVLGMITVRMRRRTDPEKEPEDQYQNSVLVPGNILQREKFG